MGKISKRGDVAEWVATEGDAQFWRSRYERAALERDEARYQLRELARQVHLWAISEYGATDVLLAAYRRAGELGESISDHTPTTTGCVYYVRQPGDRVKIGWSNSFLTRMQSLYVQPGDVLAVEEGGRELELARHRQFDAIRVVGTELFEGSDELIDLIASLRAALPDHPWEAGRRFAAGATRRRR